MAIEHIQDRIQKKVHDYESIKNENAQIWLSFMHIFIYYDNIL